MKKGILGITIIGLSVFGSTLASAQNYNPYSGQIKLEGAVSGLSEFENGEDTEQFVIEGRQGVRLGSLDYSVGQYGNTYVIGRYEKNNHPVENVDGDHVFLGMGFETFEGFGIATMVSKDEYYIAPYYKADISDFEIKGELIHRDMFDENMSSTGLKSSVGYKVNQSLLLGGSYNIRNTTKRSTDDIFSLYAQYAW
jgi:hypothetical protein